MSLAYIAHELNDSITEERLLAARRRRERSRQLVVCQRTKDEMLRMALGPGLQFAGVTEQVLDTVTNRRPPIR